ncbi:MAG: hypothetical protein DWQ10_02095, partial [Calditrichaeota bacterium]
MKKILICLGISLSCAFSLKAQDYVEIDNVECFDCHNDPEIQEDATDSTQVLFVDEDKFSNSIHGDMYCTECHMDVTDSDHDEDLEKVKCATCHDLSEEDVMASVHGSAAMKEFPEDLPTCAKCHGSHYIAEVADSSSWMSKKNQVQVCKQCHSDAAMVERHQMSAQSPIESYLNDAHGKSAASGDEDAAVCSDCHGGHLMLPHTDPNSTISRMKLAATCGECHEEQTEDYLISKHAKSLEEGGKDAPACNDCHFEHNIISKNDPKSPTSTVKVALNICSPCHTSE